MKKFILFLMLVITSPMKADTVPITSSEFAVATISRFELRRLYFMKDRWAEGVGMVTLFQRPMHSDAHLRFIRETLELTPATYYKELALAVNAGKGATITVVGSDEDMIEKVTAKDNAIGYLDADTLIITLDKSTKLLKVTD
jgi:hypothetical protein